MKYDAFISYRHLELDMYVAKQIHKRLETFKVPGTVTKKTGKKSIKRVFRDQEELPIGSDLGDNIKKALQESEFLIVICSPKTKESYWVQQEIDTFIEMHGREHVLAVLIEGEPADSFPEQLLVGNNGEPVEPLAADVRGNNKQEISKKMRTEVMRLAAPLLGCTYDDLRQRHKERKWKKAIAATAVVAGLAVAFGGYSVYNAMMIQKNYEGKQVNQSKYLADISLSLTEEGDCVTAGLIALEALPTEENDRPYVAQAQYALSQALHTYTNGNEMVADCLLKHDFVVQDIKYSQDGTKLLSVDEGNKVYVWDVETETLLLKLEPELDEDGYIDSVLSVAILEDDSLIVATKNKIRSMDLQGKENWCVQTEHYASAFEIEQETAIGLSVSNDTIQIVDLKNGTITGNVSTNSEMGSFSSIIAFSQSGQKFAVAYIGEEESLNGAVRVHDMATNSSEDYLVSAARVCQLCITEDDDLVVLSTNAKQLYGHQINLVERIDLETKNVEWSNQIEYHEPQLNDTANIVLKFRSYTDEISGEKYQQVVLSQNTQLYTWNALNGELMSQIGVTNNITAVLLAASSDTGFLLENSGNIGAYNLTDGSKYQADYIQIANNDALIVSDCLINNGVLAARKRFSPEVLLMKYATGYGMEAVNTFEASIYAMEYSQEETYYMVKPFIGGEEEVYYFYQTKDNNLVGQWSNGAKESILESGFVNDTVYMWVDENWNIVFYNVQTQEETILKCEKEFLVADICISQNGRYVFIYDADEYAVADLQEQDWVAEGEMEQSLSRVVITEDGNTVYGGTSENNMIRMDVQSCSQQPIQQEGYELYRGLFEGETIAISSDGALLAVCCMDSVMRILDTNKMETIREIEFASYNNSFVRFSPDGKRLIMQGDDFYIKVYDIEQGEFVFLNQNQLNRIVDVVFDDESDTIAILTGAQMQILNEADYVPVAYIDNALAYMPKHGYVFNSYQKKLYRFPYMDLEMLLEEAERQFGDCELTASERIKYNID